jgi:NAD(P)-dependent dehydrogenase (short-subunit alcohol dehydrogenase family)
VGTPAEAPELRVRNKGELNMQLANKVGIVTAAGSGMGHAGAVRFAKEGASVAVVDLDRGAAEGVVAEIEAAGGKAFSISGDLADATFAKRIVHDTAQRYGGLDFVWNHVGHPGPAAFEDLDLPTFDLAMTLNLRTVMVTTAAAIPFLRKRGGRLGPVYGVHVRNRWFAIQPDLFGRKIRRGGPDSFARKTIWPRKHSL